jgi:hypothetical protein
MTRVARGELGDRSISACMNGQRGCPHEAFFPHLSRVSDLLAAETRWQKTGTIFPIGTLNQCRMIGEIKSLLKQAEQYIETNAELVKLKAANSAAETISYLFGVVVIIAMVMLLLFLLLIGISLLIGHWLGRPEWGFFITAGVVAVASLVINANRDLLFKSRLCDLIIKKIFE